MDHRQEMTRPAPLRISVVMPVWQEAAILPHALEALQALEEELEIVVVDGDPRGLSLQGGPIGSPLDPAKVIIPFNKEAS